MKRLIGMAALFALTCSAVCQTRSLSDRESCRTEAVRILGARAEVLRSGNLVRAGHFQCLAILPMAAGIYGSGRKVRSGVILERVGTRWIELLRFDDTIRNPQGYVGMDFLDDEPTFGFLVQTAEKRSDETKGFTIYLTWLNPRIQPEGIGVQVAWNPKVHRFQEYAPNELDPPDFKPELPNPPKRLR